MRTITAPDDTDLLTAQAQKYKFKVAITEWIFAYPRWLSEEWQKALERVKKLMSLEARQSTEVHDADWEKLVESANALFDRIPAFARQAAMTHLQAVTCAPRTPDADPENNAPTKGPRKHSILRGEK